MKFKMLFVILMLNLCIKASVFAGHNFLLPFEFFGYNCISVDDTEEFYLYNGYSIQNNKLSDRVIRIYARPDIFSIGELTYGNFYYHIGIAEKDESGEGGFFIIVAGVEISLSYKFENDKLSQWVYQTDFFYLEAEEIEQNGDRIVIYATPRIDTENGKTVTGEKIKNIYYQALIYGLSYFIDNISKYKDDNRFSFNKISMEKTSIDEKWLLALIQKEERSR